MKRKPAWPLVDNLNVSKNAEFAPRELRIFLFAKEEDRGGANRAHDIHDCCIGDKVGKNHQGQAAKHDLPKIHAFAVNESDEADRSKNQVTDYIRAAHIEHAGWVGHAGLGSLMRASCEGAFAKRLIQGRRFDTNAAITSKLCIDQAMR